MPESLALDDKRNFVLLSFTARPILPTFSANLENATAVSRSLAYARGRSLISNHVSFTNQRVYYKLLHADNTYKYLILVKLIVRG